MVDRRRAAPRRLRLLPRPTRLAFMSPLAMPPTRRLQLIRIVGAMPGIGMGYLLARWLPLVPSTLFSALVLAGGASLSGRIAHPGAWWTLVGLACGALVGNGTVLGQALQHHDPAEHLGARVVTVLCLAIAGAVAGQRLSVASRSGGPRRPRDLLRSASGLTTGIFAGIVMLTYVHSGLDVARTLSSRLSTSLTILVISLALPGWLMHLLSHPAAERSPQS